LNPALQAAHRYGDPDRMMNIVIFSDGMTKQADRQALLQLNGRGQSNRRVFCIGIGNEVDRPLLSQLAEEAGGLAAFLSQGDDFTRQAAGFRRKLTRPAATDVVISFGDENVFDVEPRNLANLFHGSPLRLYARYRQAGPVDVTLRADVMGRPLEQTITLDLPRLDDTNPEIERMWAWHQVQRLLREADRNGSRTGVIDRIIELGERYSISTEYTSFIVLENNGEYKRWKIAQRNADRLARDRRSHETRRAQLENLRDKAAAALGPDPTERPKAAPAPTPVKQVTRRPSNAPTRDVSPRGRDLNFPNSGGGGGGAIDPITGAIVIGLVGSGLAARRRKRGPSQES
jgi:Ca-activated chloride channel family protein